ncbi:MAG: ribokinase [Actinomycetota bacterium]
MGVFVLGSLNVDLVAYVKRLPDPGETVVGKEFLSFPGGKGLNQAIAVARSGSSVAMIGALGDDNHGEFLRKTLASEGINFQEVKTLEGATGVAIIEVDEKGQNRIIVIPGANSGINSDDVAKYLAENPPHILLAQLETPLAVIIEAFKTAKKNGTYTILNPAPAQILPKELLENTDLLIPNEHEASTLTGISIKTVKDAEEAANALRQMGAKEVVITLGENGSIYSTNTATIYQKAFSANVIDTTAAGDAFCGGLAASLDREVPFQQALKYASVAGGLATEIRGAVPSLPTRDIIQRFLQSAL